MWRSRITVAFRWLAVITLALTLVQPALGPLGFFEPGASVNWELVHNIVGEWIRTFLLILLILSFFTTYRRRWWMVGVSAITFIAVNVQIVLGINSSDNVELLTMHIPLGVAILLLTLWLVLLSFGVRFNRQES